ncbi:MAG: hypothetical protein CMI01_15530 [Oceanospirillaceae bacterium]|nr:hypothetical protein [Oceanospirillaceae bacterium]
MLIAVLGAWSVLPVSIANYIFYLLILVVASCIGRAGYEHAKLRREAWLGQYLKASSTLRKPLAVGVISWFYIFPLATFLSVILLLNLRSGGLAVWGAVLFGFLVFQWSTRSLARKVEEHVIEKSVAPIVRKVSTLPAAMIMITLSVMVSLSIPHPNVKGMSWLDVMGRGTAQIEGSGILPFLELLHLGVGLTEYWAIQNTIETLGTPVMLNVLGWTLFFISECAFVWAFCRLMVGVDSLRARFSEHDV